MSFRFHRVKSQAKTARLLTIDACIYFMATVVAHYRVIRSRREHPSPLRRRPSIVPLR